jgi:ABC-type glycerol-3-phosphate transport system substrate-binding protein
VPDSASPSRSSSLPVASRPGRRWTRRSALRDGVASIAALGWAGSAFGAGRAAAAAQGTPTRNIAGTSLKILTWHHIVSDVDAWLQGFLSQWGQQNQVTTAIDFADSATIPHALKTELELGAGHDLIEHIAPLPMYARDLADLADVQTEAASRHGSPLVFCQQDGFDPATGQVYGFVHGYSPLAVFYRQSMWEAIHMASGPMSWSDLAAGAGGIWRSQGIPLGFGLSTDLDTTNAVLSALWAHGGSVIDQGGAIALESDATVAVVELFRDLYTSSMLPNVLDWTIQSNNDAMYNNLASAILNPLSAFVYSLQNRHDTGVDMRAQGPLTGDPSILAGQQPVMPAAVRFVSMVPSFSQNQDTAREFLLALVAAYDQLTTASKLYNFPAYPSTVPLLKQDGGLLDNNPALPDQGHRLSVLKTSNRWTVNLGWPAPTTPLAAAATVDGVLGRMVARAATGQLSAQDAVREAVARLETLQRELG